MTLLPNSSISRRDVLKSGAIAGGTLTAGCFDTTTNDDVSPDEPEFPEPQYGDPDREYNLSATESEVTVATDESYDGWTYNGEYPGPEIRAVEGERVRVTVENDLPEETTIHWHGMVLDGDNAGQLLDVGLNKRRIHPLRTGIDFNLFLEIAAVIFEDSSVWEVEHIQTQTLSRGQCGDSILLITSVGKYQVYGSWIRRRIRRSGFCRRTQWYRVFN